MDRRRDVARELSRRYGVLSKEGLDRLTELLQPMRVARGHELLKVGEVCRCFYYVDRGLLRQHYEKNGMDVTEHVAYEGGIVMCIESLFQQEPSRIAVEALEPSLIYALPYEPYRNYMRASFELCSFMIAILQESLIVSQQKADTLRFETAKERYLRLLRDHPDIVRRAPLHVVASFLQMTPETLSRVRAQLNTSED